MRGLLKAGAARARQRSALRRPRVRRSSVTRRRRPVSSSTAPKQKLGGAERADRQLEASSVVA